MIKMDPTISRKKKIRSQEEEKGLELALLEKAKDDQKPPSGQVLRKILGWKTINDKSEPVVLLQQNGEQSTDGSTSSGQPKTAVDNKKSSRKLEQSLPRFGPCYAMEESLMPDTKEIALEHVLRKTCPDEPSMARQIYLSALRKVEKEAREIYGDDEIIKSSGPEFRSMMMKDGCFFLQLAFLILGSPEQLGYPSNNLIFGRETNKNDAKNWIQAMFFVGNQIPLVVLEELMRQEFFNKIKINGKWENPSELTLCKKVLYEVLIMPAQGQNQHKLSDILHALHNSVMGPDPKRKRFRIGVSENDDNDLEANKKTAAEDPLSAAANKRKSTSTSAAKDETRFFPSATALNKKWIYIKKLKSGGVRSIYFTSYYLWATLHLPVLPIDEDIKVVFSNLKTYEIRQLQKNKREITSYLWLMSDIVQTSKDVRLLKRKGIIQGSLSDGDDDDEDELLEMLSSFSMEEDRTLTRGFRVLRNDIDDYTPPWRRVKSILNVVAILTLLQTIFTMLSYLKPRTPGIGS